MSLPSQSARPHSRRSHMYRRSRGKRLPRIVVVLLPVAFAALLAWKFWPGNDDASGGDDANMLAEGGGDSSEAGFSSGIGTGNDRDEESTESRERNTSPGREILAVPERTSVPAGNDDEPSIEMGATTPPSPPARQEERAAAPAPVLSRPDSQASQRALARAQQGLDLIARNKPVEARRVLTQALETPGLSSRDAVELRRTLQELNETLLFSPNAVPDDPFTLRYAIQSDDALSRLPRKLGLQVDWRLLQRINRIPNANRIRLGAQYKMITGPFHAVVHKSAYRMDVFLGEGTDRVYVRSFPVGLGEYNSTPEGRFRVKRNSKLKNPEWVNPRTGRRYLPEDPDNPIGEYWLGLEGDEDHLKDVHGYGVHGTIEPDSIGQQASMGCVRMLPDDVELVWEMLVPQVSTVEIRP